MPILLPTVSWQLINQLSASADQRLLSVKVYPKQKFPTDVVAQVKVGIDPKYANKMDTDFYALLSDGKQAIGFSIHDRSN